MIRSEPLKTALLVVAGGLLLCFWGLYNGFPFIYPDTGAYIYSGFEGSVPADRPITYGLFIRHISMAESLFWVIYAQGILTSLSIYLTLRYFLERHAPVAFIGALLFLTFFTNISAYVSFLIPDLFTPVFWLGAALILLAPLPGRRLWLVGALTGLALIMHNSNLVSGLLLAGILWMARLSPGFRQVVSMKQTAVLSGVVGLAWISLMGIHLAFSGSASLQKASHVFVLARMHELGVLKPYLDRHCGPDTALTLCRYIDALPDDFIWGADSPAGKDGGWMAHREEYRSVIWGILGTPVLLKECVVGGLNGALAQLSYFRLEHFEKWGPQSPPYEAVRTHFPEELNAYKISHQQHRSHYLDFEDQNRWQTALVFLYVLLLAATAHPAGIGGRIPQRLRQLIYFCALALVVNAVVCSALSTVVSRYQGRLVWICVLTLFMSAAVLIDWKRLIPFRESA